MKNFKVIIKYYDIYDSDRTGTVESVDVVHVQAYTEKEALKLACTSLKAIEYTRFNPYQPAYSMTAKEVKHG
jgi:hypothetical protein